MEMNVKVRRAQEMSPRPCNQNSNEKIGDMFRFLGGNSGLTEEFLYNNQPKIDEPIIPVLTGSSDVTVPFGYVSKDCLLNERKVRFYSGPSIVVVRKGKAGKMMVVDTGEFAINDDVYAMKLYDEWIDKIDLDWFVHQYQSLFYNLSTSKSDNATFNKEYAEKQDVMIIDSTIQKRISSNLKRMKAIKNHVGKIQLELLDLVNKNIIVSKASAVPLDKVVYFEGGNPGLTDEFVYDNQPHSESDTVKILSSATLDDNQMGEISRDARLGSQTFKIFKGPCILVARNGYAGTMRYVEGEFTTNDHAYVMMLNDAWKDRVNLRWFAYRFQTQFYNLVSSKSDNATFNKEYAQRTEVQIPEKSIQDRIAERLVAVETVTKNLNVIRKKIEQIERCTVKH